MGMTMAGEYRASPAEMTEGQKRNLRTSKSGALVAGPEADVISLTPVLDTNIYADNDVLFIATEIPNFFRVEGGRAKLTSLTVFDGDDQGTELTLFFTTNATTPGTINAAISAADTVFDDIQGFVQVTAFEDLINSQVASVKGIDLILEGAADSSSLYVWAAVRSGTPTYTASGMVIRFGVEHLG